jgi:hypothetical protein
MPRFAVLDHDHPFRHWDFLLEAGDHLCAWRLLSVPRHGESIVAEPLPDHRPLYLDYEGPVGGNRGRVVRWDSGTFDWVSENADEIRVTLHGGQILGTVTLRRTADGWTWQWDYRGGNAAAGGGAGA